MPNASTDASERRRPTGLGSESFPCHVIDVRAADDSDENVNIVTGIAQAFDKINDRAEVFLRGAFKKTIAERVGKGRVKITDGHIWTAKDTHGVVIDAAEKPEGLWFSARWSSASDSQSIKTKMLEKIVDELSIEFRAVNDAYKTVDGVSVRQVSEAMWNGLAILPYSSQGDAALISVRGALPFQDLPVAPMDTPWSKVEARARVVDSSRRGDSTLWPQLRKAFVHESEPGSVDGYRIQIADVVGGQLMVVPMALFRAARKLLDQPRMDEQALMSARAHVERYFAKMNAQNVTKHVVPWRYSSVDCVVADARCGYLPESRAKDAADAVNALLPALTVEARASLKAVLDAGPTETSPTTAASSGNNAAPFTDEQELKMRAQLRELELELTQWSLKP